MTAPEIKFTSDGHAELEAFLVERIYEYNARITGFNDGEVFGAALRSEAGKIIAAVNGHTWGGTCYVAHLWIDENARGDGLGRAIMSAVELEAGKRGCGQVLLATHSFQAPGFYERLGYRQRASIAEYPRGHVQLHYVKEIASASANDAVPSGCP